MERLILWLLAALVVGSLAWVLWILLRWIRSDVEPQRFRPTPPRPPDDPNKEA